MPDEFQLGVNYNETEFGSDTGVGIDPINDNRGDSHGHGVFFAVTYYNHAKWEARKGPLSERIGHGHH
jgi:hypothetical protein